MSSVIRFNSWKRYLPLLLSALVSCNASQESSDGSPANTLKEGPAKEQAQALASKTESKDTKNRPKPIAPALKPGEYCYQLSDKVQDIQARLTVAPNDQVTGSVQGNVHNESAGYYTSYRRTMDGTIDGSNLNLDVATWIEYDKQNTQETWRVSPNELSADQDTLTNKSCDQVSKAFQNENGLEAKDLTEGASRVKTQAVFFAAGKSSTRVTG